MPSRRIALALLAALVLAGAASARRAADPPQETTSVTTFVITGRGWGHGVGMSQYGALGYAKRGVTYDRILAHYYKGTTLGAAPVARMRVLLAEGLRRVTVGSPVPFRVKDGVGALYDLAAGSYAFGPGLRLKPAPDTGPVVLPGPLTFLPGAQPLKLDRPYRGRLLVSVAGKRLNVVNDVALESYVRGVVSDEMPHDWPLEAIKVQAVAARSYALAHRRGGSFDVYADTRDQVYGGVEAETPVGDQAVAQTRGQVVLFDGKVATTYYFSTSGGRTASAADVFLDAKPVPYLVSVKDPYDTLSPYHTWGPVAVPAGVAAKRLGVPGLTDLRPVPASTRAKEVVATGAEGDVTVPATAVRRALELRSTWIRVGALVLSRQEGDVAAGTSVTLTGSVRRVAGVTLEQRAAGGDWQPGPELKLQPDGSFSVAVAPAATTLYRLAAGPAKGAPLRVVVTAPA